MSNQIIEYLQNLLEQAGKAHHVYEKEELNGEHDKAWPSWYAAFLIEEGISSLIQPPPILSELAEALASITEEHEGLSQKGDWSQFAAEKLSDKYLTPKG